MVLLKIIALGLTCSITFSFGYSFQEAMESVNKHPQVGLMLNEATALKEEGNSMGSWGDPQIGVKARNLPKDSLALDESPMSGIEYSLSQNLPLTTKYSHIENSFKLLSEAKRLEAARQRKALHAMLWNYAISKRQISKDTEILTDNLAFLENMLKVTNRLYANGKVAQQAVLEIQIRKSELEAQLNNKRHQLEGVEEGLGYLAKDLKGQLDLSTVPWNILGKMAKLEHGPDEKELSLKKTAQASELALNAQKLAYVPDVTLSLSYVERDPKLDDFGDFVSAGVFFSLPLSSKRYAQADGAFAKKLKAQNQLKDYRLSRASELRRLKHDIFKLRDELQILRTKTVSFAKTSRQITAKSYGLGNATYVELTQAEIKLQNILLRMNALEGELAAKKVSHLYLSGEKLHEE